MDQITDEVDEGYAQLQAALAHIEQELEGSGARRRGWLWWLLGDG